MISTVRNPVLSRSDEPPTSFGGVDSFRSGPTRVGMRPMTRVGKYVRGGAPNRSVDG